MTPPAVAIGVFAGSSTSGRGRTRTCDPGIMSRIEVSPSARVPTSRIATCRAFENCASRGLGCRFERPVPTLFPHSGVKTATRGVPDDRALRTIDRTHFAPHR